MALRLIEFAFEGEASLDCEQLLRDRKTLCVLHAGMSEHRTLVRILLDSQFTEGVVNVLEEQFRGTSGFRLMVFAVEATLPRPEAPEEQRAKQGEQGDERSTPTSDRLSTEELYEKAGADAQLSWVYLVLVALATLVAGIGFLRNDRRSACQKVIRVNPRRFQAT
jgi:hypothetical protein